MKKRKTVRRVLFGTYTVILVLSFFLLAAVLTVLQLSEIRSRTLTRLEQENRAAALSLNREIDQMRTMAMNISYSTRMQDRLLMPNTSGEAEKLSALLSLIVLPNRPIDQINIYTKDGMRISSGLVNRIAPAGPEDQPWYADLADPERTQTLRFTGVDESLAKFSTDPYAQEFLTLAMTNYDNFGTFCGYIEIRQRVSRFAQVLSAFGPEYGEQTAFLDREGRLIWPADDPEIALICYFDTPDPDINYYGSAVAGPCFRSIMSEVLPYLGVEKVYSKAELGNLDTTTGAYVGATVEDARSLITGNKLKCVVMGKGKTVLAQNPDAYTTIPQDGTVVLYTEETTNIRKVVVPDFSNLSLTEVNQLAAEHLLNISIKGSLSSEGRSYAKLQDIAPLTEVDPYSVITVTFNQDNNIM